MRYVVVQSDIFNLCPYELEQLLHDTRVYNDKRITLSYVDVNSLFDSLKEVENIHIKNVVEGELFIYWREIIAARIYFI